LIQVNKKPEPADFDSKVRQPGLRYLVSRIAPDFKTRGCNYWNGVKEDLYEAYGRVCAYSCFYIVTDCSVDHFIPKSQRPDLAYEWDNYRLASQRINCNKSNSTDVIDPFIVKNGWFILDFPSCLVKAGSGLSKMLVIQIQKTIHELKINEDDSFVQERCELMVSYSNEEIKLPFLQKRYPFIASEILRQKISPAAARVLFRKRSK
jgi:hypothetical protein